MLICKENSATLIGGFVTDYDIAYGITGRSQRRKGVALSGLESNQMLPMHGLVQGWEDGE
jgi:hypothetical protein